MKHVKTRYKIGDLVQHRFINFGLGIIIEERKSAASYGEFLDSYIVHFPQENLKRLVYSTEINEHIRKGGHRKGE